MTGWPGSPVGTKICGSPLHPGFMAWHEPPMAPVNSPSIPGPAPTWLGRAFHGLTWKRLGIFCAMIALPMLGHAVSRLFLPDKTVAYALGTMPFFFIHLFVLFGSVWVAVTVASNLAPAQTVPRVVALVAAVVVGLVIGVGVADRGVIRIPSCFPRQRRTNRRCSRKSRQ